MDQPQPIRSLSSETIPWGLPPLPSNPSDIPFPPHQAHRDGQDFGTTNAATRSVREYSYRKLA
eukprot:1363593-Rhodomonas_salina.1